MKAKLIPLNGKHYGSEIEVVDGDISTTINIWCNADGVPSDRELSKVGVSREDWDRNIKIDDGWGGKIPIQNSGIVCDCHFESRWQHELCLKIVNALNA